MDKNPLPEFSPSAQSFRLGRYRHFKNQDKEYEAIGLARHSETLEEMVVYRALYGDKETWVRPLTNFMVQVETPEGIKPRFEFLGK